MSITDTRTVGSIVGGDDRSEGQRIESRNPANLDDLICEAVLGDADTFVDACRAARAAQRDWAARPGARCAAASIAADRPPRRGQQGGARAARHARDRQALRRVARRGAGDHRHLRLLPRRGPAPVRADGAERDARQAALHLPHARSAWPRSSRPATSRWRCRPGTSCPAMLCGNAVVWKPAEYAPALGDALARAVPSPAACRTACSTSCRPTARRAFEGLERALDEGLVDKVGFTGSSRRRLARSASCAAATCSRPASSSAARTRWS